MNLEYLFFNKWGRKQIRWETCPTGAREFIFAPFCDVPEELGKKLLDQKPDEFRAVGEAKALPTPEDSPVQSFKCPICGLESTSKAGIAAHSRAKHKEIKNEVPA